MHPVTEAGDAVKLGILRAVVYSDLFDYPLTAREVHRYLVGVRARPVEVRAALHRLAGGPLCRRGPFYFLAGRGELAAERRRRADLARRLWPLALDYGHRIVSLPFVRMVAVTGSLAMDNVECGADIDYLIVTEPGRLWVARALVGLLSRRAARAGVTICANYYVADGSLVLSDRNVYTAHELAQMRPVAGYAVYRRLWRSNPWIRDFFPNARAHRPAIGGGSAGGDPSATGGNGSTGDHPPHGRLRGLAESVLRLPPGRWLDELERLRKRRKMTRLGLDLSEAAFDRDCFKGHFDGHAARALQRYARRLTEIECAGCAPSAPAASANRMNPEARNGHHE